MRSMCFFAAIATVPRSGPYVPADHLNLCLTIALAHFHDRALIMVSKSSRGLIRLTLQDARLERRVQASRTARIDRRHGARISVVALIARRIDEEVLTRGARPKRRHRPYRAQFLRDMLPVRNPRRDRREVHDQAIGRQPRSNYRIGRQPSDELTNQCIRLVERRKRNLFASLRRSIALRRFDASGGAEAGPRRRAQIIYSPIISTRTVARGAEQRPTMTPCLPPVVQCDLDEIDVSGSSLMLQSDPRAHIR